MEKPVRKADKSSSAEDSKVSKLLRRLSREDDGEKYCAMAKQLKEALSQPENTRYLRRSTEYIKESLMDFLHTAPNANCKSMIAKCLGVFGNSLDNDLKRYLDWLFSTYNYQQDDSRIYIMNAIYETLKLDKEVFRTKKFHSLLMRKLHSALELADSSDLLMSTFNAVLVMTEMYPSIFNKYFRDTVDILVGWHIDSSLDRRVIQYVSNGLQSLAPFWIADMQFSVTLIGQFLEDMESYGQDINHTCKPCHTVSKGNAPFSPDQCVTKMTALIKVLNTVLKSLGSHLSPTLTPGVSWTYLTNACSKLLNSVLCALKFLTLNELVIYGNENASLLLSRLKNKAAPLSKELCCLIYEELDKVYDLNQAAIVSLLKFIAKVIQEVSANLPVELVRHILGSKSPILAMRFSTSMTVQDSVLAIYHSLLNLKNIPILQEAYRYILGDLERAYKIIVPSIEEFCPQNPIEDSKYNYHDVEMVIMFHLKSLADLANSGSSIVAMWALRPNILELFATKLMPYHENLLMYSPSLQYCILFVLYSHCTRYNNFVSSSSLVNANDDVSNVCDLLGLPTLLAPRLHSSPTNGHLSVVLTLLKRSLSQITPEQTQLLILGWIGEVFNHADLYFTVLQNAVEFSELLKALLSCGRSHKETVVLGVLKNIEILLSSKTAWKQWFFSSVLDLCLTHINSSYDKISSKACYLLTLLPCQITIKKIQEIEAVKKTNCIAYDISLDSLRDIQKHYISKINYVGMQGIHFKKFVAYILNGYQHSDSSWMVDTYFSCCPLRPPGSVTTENKAAFQLFRYLTSVNNATLMLWLSCEAAQFCVTSKLRTPLGKPQETFTTIESTIKQLTQDLKNIFHLSSADPCLDSNTTQRADASNGSCVKEEPVHILGSSSSCGHDSGGALLQYGSVQKNSYVFLQDQVRNQSFCQNWEQQRVGLLLEFLEHLEKYIHNAAEGCASALPAPSKPVRIFFHANRNTCAEWLSRIRVALVILSFHAGQATSVIRHSYCFLQDLVSSKNDQGVDFERIVLYLGWALCKLQEPEAIFGLYAWCRHQGRDFPWLKATAEKAAGRYEKALEGYKHIAKKFPKAVKNSPDGDNNDDALGSSVNIKSFSKAEMERLVVYFISDQLADCYVSLQNWEEFLKWKQEQESSGTISNPSNSSKSVFGNDMSLHQISVMNCFEENCTLSLTSLEKWQSFEIDYEFLNADKCWNNCILLKYVESTLKMISLKLVMEKKLHQPLPKKFSVKHKWMNSGIENCMTITHKLIQEGLQNIPSEYLKRCIVSHSAAANLLLILQENSQKNVFLTEDVETSVSHISTSLLTNMLWWNTFFDHIYGNFYQNKVNDMCLHVAKIARKEGNFNLANKLIQRVLRPCGVLGSDVTSKHFSLLEVAKRLQNFSLISGKLTNNILPMAYVEVSKLLHCLDQPNIAVHLCAITSLALEQNTNNVFPDIEEKKAKTLLTLTKWLQEMPLLVNSIQEFLPQLFGLENVHSGKELEVLGSLTGEYCEKLLHKGMEIIPATDFIIGHLLYKSIYLCPSYAKSWSKFAEWCYMWGQHIEEASGQNELILSDSDKVEIKELLPIEASEQDLKCIYAIFSQRKTETDENSEIQDTICPELIEIQLKNLEILKNSSCEQMTRLIEVWQKIQKRGLAYYELSAIAYLKFLELCGDTKGAPACATASATLRLLRLLAKRPRALRDATLGWGLSRTPARAWLGIAPQLLSRLSHGDAFVRKQAGELLCRAARHSPHLVTFPAVVGAATGARRAAAATRILEESLSQSSKESNNIENDEDSDEHDNGSCDDYKDSELKSCFLAMVNVLEKQAPEEISLVKCLVRELWRITLLWDELWLGTLIQQNAEVVRRLTQLQREIARVDENSSLDPEEQDKLIEEKHHVILKPLVHLFEQLQAVTSIPPETPHEKNFQEKFGKSIDEAMESLKHPQNPHRPFDSWQPMKQLHNRLQQRFQKRTSYVIHMADISPTLLQLSQTVIAMPGLTCHEKKVVTIASVENKVVILPTNTKPKKIIFQGSDGQTYTFLLKGLEDLHLDERIMQFLSISNAMMQEGSGRQSYQARHYSVIPLGPRSGLISWVNGAFPLFTLYKRWLQREAAMTTLKSSSSGGDAAPVQVMRPSELFYKKLTPLLKEKGISNTDNRKEWPLAVLKQVLVELMEETPQDLLAKELWCSSVNVGGWWKMVRTYSFSVAVMSMIGYIIGLGDRHLDNILVDLSTGEVIHIDYNVCFEKGKSLRVPEKVPFRFTPNIVAALGVTGMEGIFRLAAEHVLTVMKKGRETLLTLLEAFVYDPLIDWRSGNEQCYIGSIYGDQAAVLESRQSRKDLEREVTQAMFCIRVVEIKSEWLSNRDNLVSVLSQLEMELEKMSELKSKLQVMTEVLQDRHQQMSLIKEAEANGNSHSLYSLHERYSRYLHAQDSLAKAKQTLKEKLEDTEKNFNLQKVAFASVRGSQLDQWLSTLKYPVHTDIHEAFELVTEFLQNAGQGHVIVQCQQAATELEHLSQQQYLLVRTCLELLSQYGAVASLYPASHVNSHRIVCYHKWIKELMEDLTVDRCHEILSSFHSTFALDNKPCTANLQCISSYATYLQMAMQDANINFLKALEKVNAKGPPESMSIYEQDYNDSLAAMRSFLCSEPGAAFALEGVVVSALCSLNYEYLQQEKSAADSGDCLVNLMSREGEWHIDKMQITCFLLTELCNLLPISRNQSTASDSAPNLSMLIQCLTTVSKIFKGLKELNVNFQTIILPETLKGFQTEDTTVSSSVKNLEDIIGTLGCPIHELITEMQFHLRYKLLDLESPHSTAQMVTTELKRKYEALLLSSGSKTESCSTDETLSPGQMLLMGFNGLFENLQIEISTLGSTLETVNLPSSWKKIDQIVEAEKLSSPVFTEQTRHILDLIFLLKRLQTMESVFKMCREMIQIQSIYDDERLHKIVKMYTADFVGQQMLGVTSKICAMIICLLLQRLGLDIAEEIVHIELEKEKKLSLELLTQKAIETCVKNGQLNEVTLMQTSSLLTSLETAWQHRETSLANQQDVEVHKSAFQRLQLQLTTHYWLYEEAFTQNASALSRPITRTTFMQEVKNATSGLQALQKCMFDIQTKQNALVHRVEQRLKWGAGANPALADVAAAFQSSLKRQNEATSMEQTMASVVNETCNSLLQFESLRTWTPEAVACDRAFLELLDECKRTCMSANDCVNLITPLEIALIDMSTPTQQIDNMWIQNMELLISDKIKSLQRQTEYLEVSVNATQENIKKQALSVRGFLAVHFRLISDVHHFLKLMAKSQMKISSRLNDFQAICKQYSEYSNVLMQDLLKDMNLDCVLKTLIELKFMKENTDTIYSDLLEFASELQNANAEGNADSNNFSNSRKKSHGPQNGESSSKNDVASFIEDPKAIQKPGRVTQERNAYALNVWNRVRMKLEGQDPDTRKESSVSEQVDYVIHEAMHLDNLALMYEGWTPWV